MNRSDMMKRLDRSTVGIFGFGKTGRTLAEELADVAGRLVIYEDQPPSDVDRDGFELPDTTDWVFSPTVLKHDLDFLLVSPGVPGDHSILRQAREFGVPVWGDLELSFRLLEDGVVWAVTGTNGKSTCAELIGAFLEAEHGPSQVSVCGNRGTPMISEVRKDTPPEHYVVEVSSFQVEGMDRFRPDAVLLTNLGDDHMNYHATLNEYHGLKLELLKRVRSDGKVVLPEPESDRSWLRRRNVRTFDPEALRAGELEWEPDAGLNVGDDGIDREEIPVSLLQFPENVLATVALVEDTVGTDRIREALETFEPLPYRAEAVRTSNGKTVINDSKGTNPSAVQEQLNRRQGPVHLVLGGEAKQADYTALVETILENDVRSITLAGEGSTASVLSELCDRHSLTHDWIEDWESAVKSAYEKTESGETLLLSPGGTSFDAFENYKGRGEKFSHWVKEIDGR